jgi:hypothetical protein
VLGVGLAPTGLDRDRQQAIRPFSRKRTKKLLRVLTLPLPDKSATAQTKLFASFLEKEDLALLSIDQPRGRLE